MKEQIERMEREFAEMKAKLDKPEFEIGNWYKHNDGALVMYYRNEWEEATPSEIETALIKEWKRRCDKAGVSPYNCEIVSMYADGTSYKSPISIESENIKYRKSEDSLSVVISEMEWVRIYSKGNWAEIIPVKFFDWYVEKREGETRIGCEVHGNDFLQELIEALNHVRDKTVAEVLTELEKLDL